MAWRKKVEVEVVICEKLMGMQIEIKKKFSKKKKEALIQQAVAIQKQLVKKKRRLVDFFGAEPQTTDPLVYQKKVRNEWD